jgi:dTDP-4-amino-4,6-dideoxygalactose transaminase
MIRFNKPTIGKKDLESVLYCMIKDDLTPGVYMKNFASMLGQETGSSSAAVFHSFLHAYERVFHLVQAQPGDEIILASFSRPYQLRTLLRLGLKPVLVDLEGDASFLPSQEQIAKKIGTRSRCIIISQMFGIPSDLARYRDFGIPVVEDIDGCVGAKADGKPVGSFGTYAIMHLGDHAMITTGNGGMLAGKEKDAGRLISAFKNDPANIDFLMSDFNASLGISQLNKLGKSIEARRKIGQFFDDAVLAAHCSLVGRQDGQELTYPSYTLKTDTPFEECQRFFKKFGVPVRKGLEKPLHGYLLDDVKAYPLAEEMCNKLVQIPIYPGLSKEDIENIAKGIRVAL